MNLEELKVVDADVAAAIEAEMDRQNSHIELIASENWVSDAVMEAQGSIMTNKYAEGYPGKRYYGGCQCVGSDYSNDSAEGNESIPGFYFHRRYRGSRYVHYRWYSGHHHRCCYP